MAATSCVRCVVTASSSTEAEAARPSHRRRTVQSRRGILRGLAARLRRFDLRQQRRTPRGERARRRESDESRRPEDALQPGREVRLDQEGIAEQRRERRRVREREEPVGHSVLVGARVPGLQQRAGGGEQEVRKPHGHREQRQDAQRGVRDHRALPGGVGQDRQHVPGWRPAPGCG